MKTKGKNPEGSCLLVRKTGLKLRGTVLKNGCREDPLKNWGKGRRQSLAGEERRLAN